MKKLFLILTSMFLFILPTFAEPQNVMLQTGISIEKIPKAFYGTWRVTSKLTSTNKQGLFKEKGVDLWNLSRQGNVITLNNPISGANASIIVDSAQGSYVKFKKVGDYDGKKLTDTVKINLGKDTFTGVNNLKLDTISDIDGHVLTTEWAVYQISGEKISGDSLRK